MIYLAQGAQIALFIVKKITSPAEYTDFDEVFLKKLAKVLLKQISINKHFIKLIDNK